MLGCFLHGLASVAEATNFAVLFKGDGCTPDTCDRDSEYLTISNPLYEESNQQGESPLYEPSAIIISPPQLAAGRDVLFTLNFNESVSGSFPPAIPGSYVFELKLEDAATGEAITDFGKPIDVRFRMPRLDALLEQGAFHERLALGFLDESVDPPVWRAEDDTLEVCPPASGDEKLICGKTTHFTLFSIGPIPEPASASLCLFGLVAMAAKRRRD